MDKQKDVLLSPQSPEAKHRWLHEPQNLMRKHVLFQQLLNSIEHAQRSYAPIFNEDKELLYLTENLQRRLKEIESELER